MLLICTRVRTSAASRRCGSPVLGAVAVCWGRRLSIDASASPILSSTCIYIYIYILFHFCVGPACYPKDQRVYVAVGALRAGISPSVPLGHCTVPSLLRHRPLPPHTTLFLFSTTFTQRGGTSIFTTPMNSRDGERRAEASPSPPLTEDEELMLCGAAPGTAIARWLRSVKAQLHDRYLLRRSGGSVATTPLQIPDAVLHPAVVPLPGVDSSRRVPSGGRTEHFVRQMYNRRAEMDCETDIQVEEISALDSCSPSRSRSIPWVPPSIDEGIETKVYRDRRELPDIITGRTASIDINDKEAVAHRLRSLKRVLRQQQAATAVGLYGAAARPSGSPPPTRSGVLPPLSPLRRHRKSRSKSAEAEALYHYWVERTRVVVMSLGNVTRPRQSAAASPLSGDLELERFLCLFLSHTAGCLLCWTRVLFEMDRDGPTGGINVYAHPLLKRTHVYAVGSLVIIASWLEAICGAKFLTDPLHICYRLCIRLFHCTHLSSCASFFLDFLLLFFGLFVCLPALAVCLNPLAAVKTGKPITLESEKIPATYYTTVSLRINDKYSTPQRRYTLLLPSPHTHVADKMRPVNPSSSFSSMSIAPFEHYDGANYAETEKTYLFYDQKIVSPASGRFLMLISDLIEPFFDPSAMSDPPEMKDLFSGGNKEIAELCDMARTCIAEEPTIIGVDVRRYDDLVVVGDIHGQFYDMLFSILSVQLEKRKAEMQDEAPVASKRQTRMDDCKRSSRFAVDSREHSFTSLSSSFKFDQIFELNETSTANSPDLSDSSKDGCTSVWLKFNAVFCWLPLGALIRCGAGYCFCTHGGLCPQTNSIEMLQRLKRDEYSPSENESSLTDISPASSFSSLFPDTPKRGSRPSSAFASTKVPNQSDIISGLLWSDPEENHRGCVSSARGCGYIFGDDVTQAFLEHNNNPKYAPTVHRKYSPRRSDMTAELLPMESKKIHCLIRGHQCIANGGNKGAIAILRGEAHDMIAHRKEKIEFEFRTYDSYSSLVESPRQPSSTSARIPPPPINKLLNPPRFKHPILESYFDDGPAKPTYRRVGAALGDEGGLQHVTHIAQVRYRLRCEHFLHIAQILRCSIPWNDKPQLTESVRRSAILHGPTRVRHTKGSPNPNGLIRSKTATVQHRCFHGSEATNNKILVDRSLLLSFSDSLFCLKNKLTKNSNTNTLTHNSRSMIIIIIFGVWFSFYLYFYFFFSFKRDVFPLDESFLNPCSHPQSGLQIVPRPVDGSMRRVFLYIYIYIYIYISSTALCCAGIPPTTTPRSWLPPPPTPPKDQTNRIEEQIRKKEQSRVLTQPYLLLVLAMIPSRQQCPCGGPYRPALLFLFLGSTLRIYYYYYYYLNFSTLLLIPVLLVLQLKIFAYYASSVPQ
eukprot:gene7303-5145_t